MCGLLCDLSPLGSRACTLGRAVPNDTRHRRLRVVEVTYGIRAGERHAVAAKATVRGAGQFRWPRGGRCRWVALESCAVSALCASRSLSESTVDASRYRLRIADGFLCVPNALGQLHLGCFFQNKFYRKKVPARLSLPGKPVFPSEDGAT